MKLIIKFALFVSFLVLCSCQVANRFDETVDQTVSGIARSGAISRSASKSLFFGRNIIAIHPGNDIQIQKAIKSYFFGSGIKTVALRDTFNSRYSNFLVINCQQNKNYKSNFGVIANTVECVFKEGHSDTVVFHGEGTYESYLKNLKNTYKATLIALENSSKSSLSMSATNIDKKLEVNELKKESVVLQSNNIVLSPQQSIKTTQELMPIVQNSFQNLNQSEQRTALIIGVAKYQYISSLSNSANDAKDMAELLTKLGFSVTLLLNSSQIDIEDKIHEFGRKLIKNGGVGLFYFAGHGVQHANTNFLIPVDANLKTQRDLKYKAVSLEMVLDQMDEARNGLNIIILDACRNNPLPAGPRSMSSGLAQVAAPKGSFVAFATSPNDVASDGLGRNGVFTKYLLKHLGQKGKSLEAIFKTIRKGVYNETSGEQTPWVNSSFIGEFSFAP